MKMTNEVKKAIEAAYVKGSFREKDIINNLESFEIEQHGELRVANIFHINGEGCQIVLNNERGYTIGDITN